MQDIKGFDEGQLDKIRSALLRYRTHKRVNGRHLPWKTVHDHVITSPLTSFEYDQETGIPPFSEETLRRFALGQQALDSDWKVSEITNFLISQDMLTFEGLEKSKINNIRQFLPYMRMYRDNEIIDSSEEMHRYVGIWSTNEHIRFPQAAKYGYKSIRWDVEIVNDDNFQVLNVKEHITIKYKTASKEKNFTSYFSTGFIIPSSDDSFFVIVLDELSGRLKVYTPLTATHISKDTGCIFITGQGQNIKRANYRDYELVEDRFKRTGSVYPKIDEAYSDAINNIEVVLLLISEENNG